MGGYYLHKNENHNSAFADAVMLIHYYSKVVVSLSSI